jgi:hypothetical protein
MILNEFDLKLEDPRYETIMPFYSIGIAEPPKVNFIISNIK